MHNRFLSISLIFALAVFLSGCSQSSTPNTNGANPTGMAPTSAAQNPNIKSDQQQERMAHVNAMRDAARRAHEHAGSPQ